MASTRYSDVQNEALVWVKLVRDNATNKFKVNGKLLQAVRIMYIYSRELVLVKPGKAVVSRSMSRLCALHSGYRSVTLFAALDLLWSPEILPYIGVRKSLSSRHSSCPPVCCLIITW